MPISEQQFDEFFELLFGLRRYAEVRGGKDMLAAVEHAERAALMEMFRIQTAGPPIMVQIWPNKCHDIIRATPPDH